MSRKESPVRFAQTFFGHGSNLFIAMTLGALIFNLARTGDAGRCLPYVITGLLIFFLMEYITHRFQFHAPPVGSDFLKRLQRRMHYDHHVEPNRMDLLFLPIWYAIPAVVIYTLLYYKLTGSVMVTQGLLVGNLLGLLYYEYVHFSAHVNITPRTAWGRYMKKYHLWHHYKNEHYWYGVTNPLFDYLFGTYKDQGEAERSTTVRDLHGSSQH